jgi:hypothetical protein
VLEELRVKETLVGKQFLMGSLNFGRDERDRLC